jgi:hypothetical protein
MVAGRIAIRHIIGDRSNPASITDGVVTPAKLQGDFLNGRYRFTRFDAQPITVNIDTTVGFGNPLGALGSVNAMHCASGLQTKFSVLVGQVILAPVLDQTGQGLDVSQDQTNTRGTEHIFGSDGSFTAVTAPITPSYSFVVGTDPGFFHRITFKLTTLAGLGTFFFGWRKQQAFAVALATYTDFAGFSIVGPQGAAAVNIATQVASGGQVNTAAGVTFNNADIHTLEVRVIAGRAVYLFDNAVVAGAPVYTFTNALQLVPTWFYKQGATPSTCFWQFHEIGTRRSVSQTGSSQG